jgi:hypothetical protein
MNIHLGKQARQIFYERRKRRINGYTKRKKGEQMDMQEGKQERMTRWMYKEEKKRD